MHLLDFISLVERLKDLGFKIGYSLFHCLGLRCFELDDLLKGEKL